METNTYTIQITKTIVVEVEAETEAEALKYASDPDEGWDGAFDRAEPVAERLRMDGEA
jgi:hypothetical protein